MDKCPLCGCRHAVALSHAPDGVIVIWDVKPVWSICGGGLREPMKAIIEGWCDGTWIPSNEPERCFRSDEEELFEL